MQFDYTKNNAKHRYNMTLYSYMYLVGHNKGDVQVKRNSVTVVTSYRTGTLTQLV